MNLSSSIMIGSKKLAPWILRRERERLDLSQEELGELIGVHRNTVSNWERSPEEGGGAPLMMAYALVGIYVERGNLPAAMRLFRQGDLFPEESGGDLQELVG